VQLKKMRAVEMHLGFAESISAAYTVLQLFISGVKVW
jgi:hypothetical protein